MVVRLARKAENLGLGYKGSKAITCAMKALYKKDRLFDRRHKFLENAKAILAKGSFID